MDVRKALLVTGKQRFSEKSFQVISIKQKQSHNNHYKTMTSMALRNRYQHQQMEEEKQSHERKIETISNVRSNITTSKRYCNVCFLRCHHYTRRCDNRLLMTMILHCCFWVAAMIQNGCSNVNAFVQLQQFVPIRNDIMQQQQQQLVHQVMMVVRRIDSTKMKIPKATGRTSPTKTRLLLAMSDRENEIRRKIQNLKKQGKIQKKDDIFDGMDDDIDDDDDVGKGTIDDYSDKIRQKLGTAKSKMLGFVDVGSTDEDEPSSSSSSFPKAELNPTEERSVVDAPPRGRIGSLSTSSDVVDATAAGYQRPKEENFVTADDGNDDTLYENDDTDDSFVQEQDLVDLVAQKMQEKRDRENREKLDRLQTEARERIEQLERERQEAAAATAAKTNTTSPSTQNKQQEQRQLTSGVGGSWSKDSNDNNDELDMYKPKSGSWGAFPRPRDISKAYGGGRRVGPGYSNESERLKSEEETRERLKNYRVKMGIDVESEKIHEDEINDALKIAGLAMQRGIYSTAVSALEKVTKYCSTNSKVGGKVFLELAMAYEAVGRTKEAIAVYSTLSKSRIEKIKINAKRLLYGIEAMQFMQENVGSDAFSRKKASSTFIDTTGLANIASKFDDRYETAYIDLSSKSNYYKRLTESVVRSPREARQILLMATGPGEVERLRIVQALRSLSRRFDESLQQEIEANSSKLKEPVAVMNGKPILQEDVTNEREPIRQKLLELQRPAAGSSSSDTNYDDDEDYDEELEALMALDEYVLKDASKMKEALNGEWRLQLLADKRGDGVKFFNTSIAWQSIDTSSMSFTSMGPSAFLSTFQKSGSISLNDKRRILRRADVDIGGDGAGGMMWGLVTGLLSGKQQTGPLGAIVSPQQVVLVDSVLLMTRNVPPRYIKNTSARTNDDEKDYFAVWRRVEPGTYSTASSSRQRQ